MWPLRRFKPKRVPVPSNVMRVARHPTDADLVDGVRRWLNMLAESDFAGAVEAVHFTHVQSAEGLRARLESFFGPNDRASIDRPSEQVLRRTEIHRDGVPSDCVAVVGFFIPRTDGMGIWTTFLVRALAEHCYFEFEIFHA